LPTHRKAFVRAARTTIAMIAGIGSDMGAVHLARNSWDKYAYDLAPLKGQWGIG
jgi:hypothetical protein